MENIIGFIFLSVLSSIMATMMNNYALGKIQASTVAAAGGLSTVVTVAADVVMNKATLYWYHYVSVTLILICSVGMMLYNGGSCVKE